MDQLRFFIIITRLRPGHRIQFKPHEIREVVLREQPSLLFASMPTTQEVEEFMAKISRNWEVNVFYNYEYHCWIVEKPEKEEHINVPAEESMCIRPPGMHSENSMSPLLSFQKVQRSQNIKRSKR